MKKILLILLICSTAYGSNEIRAYFETGQTLYATIRNASGQAWDTAGNTFENYDSIEQYDISMSDKSGDMYLADFDTDITEGSYSIVIFEQTGDSPGDSNDYAIAFEEGYWTGSVWKSNQKQLVDIVEDTNEIQTDLKDGGRLDLIFDAIKKYTDLIVIVETDINDVNDASNFTVTDGNNVADIFNGSIIMVQDATDSHWESRIIKDWDTDLEVTLDTDLGFTPVANDLAYIVHLYLGNIWERIQNLGMTTNVVNTISGGSAGQGVTIFNPEGDDP